MGKRKSHSNFDPDQDELNLGSSEGENGTVPAPDEAASRARVPRITAGDAATAHDASGSEAAGDGRSAPRGVRLQRGPRVYHRLQLLRRRLRGRGWGHSAGRS